MTSICGCGEGRTMASQPSEERNLLRLRAWEQRNQETGQATELNQMNVPLFGEPYKTTKGDELSDRIRRMLGSYEDNCTIEPLPFPTYATLPQSDQVQSNAEKSSKPPFHNQVHCTSTQSQKGPSSNAYPTQPTRTPALSSPIHQEHLSKVPINHSQDSQINHSTYQQPKSEAFSDLREPVNLSQEKPAESPDAKPLPFLHSSDHNNTEPKDMHADTFERHQHQGSAEYPPESASTTDASVANLTQTSKDASPPQAKNISALPSQTFPPPLSAKQPSAAMTQKPTAYVRPMDGQDQVVSESPELKPSPEPYAPLPEITLNKSNQGKKKILPQYLETKTNEVHCVEDILREMTHSWPPLLTTIHTPCTDEPSKSPFPAKEAGHVSSYPGQKTCHPSTTDPSHLQQSSSSLPAEAHSSEVESASSSDSETNSKSESDSESTIEEPLQPLMSSSVKTDMSAPAVTHSDWQLGQWIRSNQHNSSSDGLGAAHVSQSPTTQKQIPPTHSFKHTSVDVVDPTRESQSQLPSNQNQFSDNLTSSEHSTSCQDNYYQQRNQKPSSTDLSSCTGIRKRSGNPQLSEPAKSALRDNTEDALSVKSNQMTIVREKDSCFSKRPKVKTKMGRCKKSEDGRNTKKDSKSTDKGTSLDKRKTGSEPGHDVSPVQCGHCLSCGMRYSKPCSCPTHSLVPPDQPSPATSVTFSCSKPEAETVCQKITKVPQKTCPEIRNSSERTTKVSQDNSKAPRSLVVKINLNLLSRIPSGIHQDTPSSTKRPAAEESHGGGTDVCLIHKLTKTSLKTIHSNVEVDNKTVPRKKQRLENKSSSSVTVKLKGSSNPSEDRERTKAKKNHTSLHLTSAPGDATKRTQREQKTCSGEIRESSKEAGKSRDSHKHKKSSEKKTAHPDSEKQKPAKDSLALPSRSEPTPGATSSRPLLRFEDRQYPVKHYIKEAKRLKHKADAESDKLSKVFNYLDAAMYFIESGNAMEKDPQISMSSYTMFAETVELLKFVLKLLSSAGSCTSPTEKDFLALCLRCQSVLQMAMFRYKQKTALKYSKTLTDHFNSSAQATPDRSKGKDTPSTISPANTPSSSGPGSNHSSAGGASAPLSSTVAVPQAIEQVAFTYVNITTLLLSAHELWEQAEELAHKGSGLLTELDSVLGRLSLTTSTNTMVRYTRQGLHWLRTNGQKVK